MSILTASAPSTGATSAPVAGVVNNNENEHLLEHKWVLWFRPPVPHTNSSTPSKNWENSQKKMFEAESVEQFWREFHKVPRIRPGHSVNCDYSLFKSGVMPAWEDDFNKNGGRWTYNIERRNVSTHNIPKMIEQAWLDVMLCLIGEQFEEYGESIAGGVVGIRQPKGTKSNTDMSAKIHIWTKDANDQAGNQKIGEILKHILHAGDGQLTFSPHESTGGKGRIYLKL